MPTSILTTDDLREFKLELFEELEELWTKYNSAQKHKKWLRTADVRKQLKISHGTLQNLRNKDIIKAYKIEGILFYDAAEIDAVILNNPIYDED